MEKEVKKEKEKLKVNKGYKKSKTVNWESFKDFKKLKKDEEIKKANESVKDLLEIEIIDPDGKIIKEQVKYEHKITKEFSKKRVENSHNEYTKAKEFFVNHKSDEDE